MNIHKIQIFKKIQSNSFKLSENSSNYLNWLKNSENSKNSQLSSYTPKHSKIKLSTYTLLLNITTKLLYLYH